LADLWAILTTTISKTHSQLQVLCKLAVLIKAEACLVDLQLRSQAQVM